MISAMEEKAANKAACGLEDGGSGGLLGSVTASQVRRPCTRLTYQRDETRAVSGGVAGARGPEGQGLLSTGKVSPVTGSSEQFPNITFVSAVVRRLDM